MVAHVHSDAKSPVSNASFIISTKSATWKDHVFTLPVPPQYRSSIALPESPIDPRPD